MNSDTFEHTLPDGTVVKHASADDLFKSILDELGQIRDRMRDLLHDVDNCAITVVKQWRELASKRGEFLIVEADGDVVDLIFRPKREPEERKPG